jgi:hypothetical protein
MPSKIAERIDGMGKRIGKVLPSMQGGFLTNKWILYLVLFSAVFDLFYFYQKGDMYALTIFFIIGFLVSFFSKNMVVVLILAIALTHLIRYGKNLSEGFEDDDEDKDGFEGEEEEKEGFEGEEEEKDGFEGEEEDKEGFEDEEEKQETFEDPPEEETFTNSSAYKIQKTAEDFKNLTPSNVDDRTKQLLANQKELMATMKSLEPVLAKAEGFLNTSGNAKEKFTNLADAYGPLKR